MSQTVSEVVVGKLQHLIGKGQSVPHIVGTKRLGELEVDSLKIVELIFECESSYEIQVDENELQRIETVGDLIALIERSVAAKIDA